MNRTVLIGVVIMAISLLNNLNLSAQDLTKMSYETYLDRDLDKWEQIIKEAANKSEINNPVATFQLAFAQFGLLGATMYTNDEQLFDKYLSSTHSLLESLIESDESWAEPWAVASFVMGLQIANSPMKAIYLGPKSISFMNEAVKLKDKSPVVMQLYAGSKYFFPKLFGGDINEAIISYTIAIELFEVQGRTNEWLYLDAMAYLGKSYVRTGETKKAIAIYEKALHAEPDFHWIKDTLLPQVQIANSN
jgi:tetratricopeptide (TPR) repeat protein